MRALLPLLLAALLLPQASFSSETSHCKAKLQPALQSLNTSLQNNIFNVSRDLADYRRYLKAPNIPTLTQILSTLPQGSTYLDAGAGEAKTLRELARQNTIKRKSLKLVALSYKRPDNAALLADLKTLEDQFSYIQGGYAEELINDKSSHLYSLRGRVSLITDIYGPMLYTLDIAALLNTYADLLKVGGHALLNFYEGTTSFSVTSDGRAFRLTLRELSDLIPHLTGGRLQVKEAQMMKTFEDSASFITTVFYLEKTQEKAEASDNPLKLVNLEHDGDGAPRRYYEVASWYTQALDPYDLRVQDIEKRRRQPGASKFIHIPQEYIFTKRPLK